MSLVRDIRRFWTKWHVQSTALYLISWLLSPPKFQGVVCDVSNHSPEQLLYILFLHANILQTCFSSFLQGQTLLLESLYFVLTIMPAENTVVSWGKGASLTGARGNYEGGAVVHRRACVLVLNSRSLLPPRHKDVPTTENLRIHHRAVCARKRKFSLWLDTSSKKCVCLTAKSQKCCNGQLSFQRACVQSVSIHVFCSRMHFTHAYVTRTFPNKTSMQLCTHQCNFSRRTYIYTL